MDKTQFNFSPSEGLCPFDSIKWEELKARGNCSDQELYHCLPNQYNVHGQICVKPNWVLKNYCPIYNTVAAKIDLIPCDSQYGACSDNDYRSNQVYMYSGCLNNTEILKEKTSDTPPIESIAFPLHSIIIIVVAAALLLILVGSIFFFCTRRKAKKYETGYELEPLLGQSEIPTGFKKTNDYLKNRVFTSSKFYELAIGALDIYRCITIVGPPGCGKTLTALQLASRKCGRGGRSQLYFCQTLEEIFTTAQEDSEAYIIMDDWLDKYVYYPSTLCSAIQSLNEIYENLIKDEKIHLIITVQEDKYRRFRSSLKDCYLFQQPYLLAINSEIFSELERKSMVLCHFNHFDIEESCGNENDSLQEKKTVDYKCQSKIPSNQAEGSVKEETDQFMKKKITVKKGTLQILARKIKGEKDFSFPVVVDMLCINERLMKALDRVLNGFTDTLTNFLNTWSNDEDIKERRSYCILVFAALLGGEISPRDFSGYGTGPVYNRICSEYACQLNANKETKGKEESNQNECIDLQSDEELLKTNLRLKSCLYRIRKGQNDPCFVFHHSSLLRFILLHIKKTKGELFLIENATIEVLLNKCWLEVRILEKLLPGKQKATFESLEGTVSFSTSSLMPLAERIFSEMRSGYCLPEWDKHVFLSHDIFCDLWKKCFENIQTRESNETERASNTEKT